MALFKAMQDRKIEAIVNEFQSDTTALLGRKEPWLVRSMLYLCLAMTLSFVVWASWSELDKVVIARAEVETVSPKIVVQPMQTAIIKAINVEPGQVVKAGDVLAVLDSTFTQADSNQVESKTRALDAQIARLTAERDDKPFNPIILGADADYMKLQKSLYEERKGQYRLRLKNFDERTAEVKTTLDKRRAEISVLQSKLDVGQEVESMRKRLYESETGSRLNYLGAQANRLDMEHTHEMAKRNVEELRHQLEAITAERGTYVQTWKSSIAEELAKAQGDRDSVAEQLSKVHRLSQLVELRAPMDAVVLDIAERSVGSIIREAETFFRLVPVDSPLQVIAYFNASDIGSLNVGNEVHVKLDAFPYMEHGTINAVLKTLSADTFNSREVSPPGADPLRATPGATYYKGRLEIVSNELYNMPQGFMLIPGMTASAEAKVGKRSIMKYLLSPVWKSIDQGMREP
jgi:HlyD family type I secretion membrane fusion protein